MPLLCNTFPAISPWNIWDLETGVFDLLVRAAEKKE